MIYYCYYPILCTFVRYKRFMCAHNKKQKPRIIQNNAKLKLTKNLAPINGDYILDVVEEKTYQTAKTRK